MQALKDYENNKWKIIGEKAGKPAKVRVLREYPTLVNEVEQYVIRDDGPSFLTIIDHLVVWPLAAFATQGISIRLLFMLARRC